MSAAFTAQLKLPSVGRIEEHHRFDPEAAIFGAPRTRVHQYRVSRSFRQACSQVRRGIGKARAVEMAFEAEFMGGSGEGRKLIERIDLAALSNLGDGYRAALGAMYAAGFFGGDRGAQGLGGHLVVAPDESELGAAGVEFGGVAFIFVDMRGGGAEDRLPRLR